MEIYRFYGHYWSGKYHASVQGINLVTTCYTDTQVNHYPINFRVVDKNENKKLLFSENICRAFSLGLKPAMVRASWYAYAKNLKAIRNIAWNNCLTPKTTIQFHLEKGAGNKLDYSKSLKIVKSSGLKEGSGDVKLFRIQLKTQLHHYAVYLPNEEKLAEFNDDEFDIEHDKHWQTKQYHRVIKQVSYIENFQVRVKQSTKNYLFAAIIGFVQLQRLTTIQVIKDCYQVRRKLFINVMKSFILECAFVTNNLNQI
jgi:hypothetical protein